MLINKAVNLAALFHRPGRRDYQEIIAPIKEAFQVASEMAGTDTDDLKWMVAGVMLRFVSDEEAKERVKPFADFFVDDVIPQFKKGIATSRQDIHDWLGAYAVAWMEAHAGNPQDVIPLSEAERIWGKTNLRGNARGRMLMWKSGSTWLTTRQAMEALYGVIEPDA